MGRSTYEDSRDVAFTWSRADADDAVCQIHDHVIAKT
jgi:hypothetical protein